MSLDPFGAFTLSTTGHYDDAPAIAPEPPSFATDRRNREQRDRAPARELRENMAAVSVSFTWFGTRRAVTTDQRQQMADPFDAEGSFISAGKKLLNTKHPAFRAVTAIRSKILTDWKESSLPFPEPGIRLINRDHIDDFARRMEDARDELNAAVAALDSAFDEIREEARRRLGALYNREDYPSSLAGLFAVAWTFPNVDPPDYLMQLRPALYEQERARIASQFDEAVRLAEEAFTQQLADAIGHLCERLGREENGNARVFRDSAVTNLTDFFERFRSLSVRSNPQLDALVEQAQQAVRGASPARLRQSTDFRERVAAQLASVGETLSAMTVERPRRKIQRDARPAPTGGTES